MAADENQAGVRLRRKTTAADRVITGTAMQKAIIVRYRYREERREYALAELNEELRDGWRVVSMSPLGAAPVPSSSGKKTVTLFTSLVILEKEGE